MLFKLADENNDGQISQKEAVDAGNLLVGGFFFRADANGDGVLSKDEARAARDAFLAQQPVMRVFVEKNQGAAAGDPGLARGQRPAGVRGPGRHQQRRQPPGERGPPGGPDGRHGPLRRRPTPTATAT